MKSYTYSELAHALRVLDLGEGDVLLVQTSLLDLGPMQGNAPRQIPAQFLKAIRDCVGDSGTVCVQCFSFGPTRGELYDSTKPCYETGAFAEYLRTQPGAIRSPHPFHSLVAQGPFALDICAADPKSGYDSDGPYGRLLAHDAKLLLIGERNVDTASFAHFAEERARVPYRYWKDFKVHYKCSQIIEQRTYSMYVRNLALNLASDPKKVCEELASQGLFRKYSLGASNIRSVSARDLVAAIMDRLKTDPYCMVTKISP